MQLTPNAEADRTATLVEAAPVPPRALRVTALPDFRLAISFEDGLTGVVDCRPLIHSATAGVFAALQDPAEFATVHLQYGAVTWACHLDLAPDAMYDAICRDRVWAPR